ncbi:hypothetical protein [Kitasatospora sp. NPDC059803]|uniref:hypothetical protein n=1 Tax=unclassified Kitasatospora TaxID=2633591 RepID=UPI0036695F54
MPRRPPGALRAQTRYARGSQPRPFSQIRGLRRNAQAAVRRLEARRFEPGYLSRALGQYEEFLRQPGRWLYVPLPDCPCHDVLGARDEIEAMLPALLPRARCELGRIVAGLDTEFERRTLPDPYAARRPSSVRPDASGRPWWYRRLTGP